MKPKPTLTKEHVREVMQAVEAEMPNSSDMKYWMLVHERLELPYGELFPFLRKYPEFFEVTYE